MKTILELIKERVVIYDGAMGTQLIKKGLGKRDCPEMWNLERGDVIKSIHQSYYTAGSDVVQTNTFGANPLNLKNYGLESRLEDIILAGCRLAREVCPPDCYVAGDIGPTGKLLKPLGGYTPEQFEEAFTQQAMCLQKGGVDFISVETMSDLQESCLALKSALKTGLPVFVSLTFDRKKKGFFTLMGNSPLQAMKKLQEDGASVVGANCTLASADFVELAREIRQATDLPVIIQPNAGKPQLKDGQVYYTETADDFVNSVKEMIALGINVIGGCCGTGPEFIHKLKA